MNTGKKDSHCNRINTSRHIFHLKKCDCIRYVLTANRLSLIMATWDPFIAVDSPWVFNRSSSLALGPASPNQMETVTQDLRDHQNRFLYLSLSNDFFRCGQVKVHLRIAHFELAHCLFFGLRVEYLDARRWACHKVTSLSVREWNGLPDSFRSCFRAVSCSTGVRTICQSMLDMTAVQFLMVHRTEAVPLNIWPCFDFENGHFVFLFEIGFLCSAVFSVGSPCCQGNFFATVFQQLI